MAGAAPNTPKKFVRLAREQRVSAILSAALAVFAERGYEAAAVSEIAERAGVVEGTVYKYFESKRALLLTVLILLMNSLAAWLMPRRQGS